MQGEINPLDTPFMFEVMRITKFETGYVVNALGHTWACETPKSLAKRVQSWATELEQNARQMMGRPTGDQGSFESKIPPPSEPAPTWDNQFADFKDFKPEWNNLPLHPERNNVPIAQPTEPQLLRTDEQMLAIQREQLEVLCDALFSDLIQEDDFYRGIRQYCPDISGEEIGEALDAAHDQNNAGAADEDLAQRWQRVRDRNSVPVLRVDSSAPMEDNTSVNGEPVAGIEGSRLRHAPDTEPEDLAGSVGDGPALRTEPEAGFGVVGERLDQGQLRPLTRRRALDRTTRPGMSHPRPEDVDRFDE